MRAHFTPVLLPGLFARSNSVLYRRLYRLLLVSPSYRRKAVYLPLFNSRSCIFGMVGPDCVPTLPELGWGSIGPYSSSSSSPTDCSCTFPRSPAPSYARSDDSLTWLRIGCSSTLWRALWRVAGSYHPSASSPRFLFCQTRESFRKGSLERTISSQSSSIAPSPLLLSCLQ